MNKLRRRRADRCILPLLSRGHNREAGGTNRGGAVAWIGIVLAESRCVPTGTYVLSVPTGTFVPAMLGNYILGTLPYFCYS
jgi:hypothetical protein